MGLKKYEVEGQIFNFCCDASEKSFQFCKKFIRNQQFSENLRVIEYDGRSYQVYDTETKEVLYVSRVTQVS